MPSKSKAQQRLFGIAYAVRKVRLDKDDVNNKVEKLVNSKISTKDIRKFAKTKHKGLPEYVKEHLINSPLSESIWDIDNNIEDENEEFVKDKIKKFIDKYYSFTTALDIIHSNSFYDYPSKHIKYKVKNNKYILNVPGSLICFIYDDMNELTNDLFEWGEIKGYFNCANTAITSLKGAPKVVRGDFDCTHCVNLTSLDGAPEKIYGDFYCKACENLTSLKGAPKIVKGDFYCKDCPIRSLDGIGKVEKGIWT